jgi:hypothetical protein
MWSSILTLHCCSSVLYHFAGLTASLRAKPGPLLSIKSYPLFPQLYFSQDFYHRCEFSIFSFPSSQRAVSQTKEESESPANLCTMPIISTPLLRLLLLRTSFYFVWNTVPEQFPTGYLEIKRLPRPFCLFVVRISILNHFHLNIKAAYRIV